MAREQLGENKPRLENGTSSRGSRNERTAIFSYARSGKVNAKVTTALFCARERERERERESERERERERENIRTCVYVDCREMERVTVSRVRVARCLTGEHQGHDGRSCPATHGAIFESPAFCHRSINVQQASFPFLTGSCQRCYETRCLLRSHS